MPKTQAPSQMQTRDLCVTALSIRAESIDENARTVQAVLATENPVAVYDMHSFRVIDEVLIAAGAELPTQMPLLADHNRWSIDAVRGSIRHMRRDGNSIVGTLHFAEDEDSERAWQKVKGRHLTDVSVGYQSLKAIDLAPGEQRVIDGRNYKAGDRTLRISQQWQPREGSLTPIGADPSAKIRQAVITEGVAGETPIEATTRKIPVTRVNFRGELVTDEIAIAEPTPCPPLSLLSFT